MTWVVSQATRWKTREEVCWNQRRSLKGIRSTFTSISVRYQHGVRRHFSEVHQEVQIQQVAGGEEDMNCLSLAEGPHHHKSVYDKQTL